MTFAPPHGKFVSRWGIMTRPRKRILLVNPDEMEASYLSCLLDVRGYRVMVASDAR